MSSASGRPAKMSPSSPTTGCTRCSTAARSRPASPSATAGGSSCTRRWASWPRSSTSRRSPRCAAISRWRTAGTPRPVRRCGRTRSRRSGPRRTVSIALGHNGNLTNTRELAAMLPPESGVAAPAGDLGHRRADRADRRGRAWTGGGVEEAAARILPLVRGRLLARLHGREHAVRGARPAGIPAAGDRPAQPRAGWWRARPPRWTSWAPSFVREVQPGELHLARRAGRAVARYSRRPRRRCACSSTSTWPGPTPRSAAAGCTRPASRSGGRLAGGAPGRRGPGDPGAGVGDARGDRLRGGQRHPLRSGPGEELLRRAGPSSSRARPSGSWASG